MSTNKHYAEALQTILDNTQGLTSMEITTRYRTALQLAIAYIEGLDEKQKEQQESTWLIKR